MITSSCRIKEGKQQHFFEGLAKAQWPPAVAVESACTWSTAQSTAVMHDCTGRAAKVLVILHVALSLLAKLLD
jgi:hypothetical protein